MSFFPIGDHRLLLCNGNTTAIRNYGCRHGILIADQPLINNDPFEVKLEVLLESEEGSLDMGVTTMNPANMAVPVSATSLRNSAWMLSGTSILHDGVAINTNYGVDLRSLVEGDNLAVMRSSAGELFFYLNGQCLGVAAQNVPEMLYPIIDLCGKSAQVSINNPAIMAASLTTACIDAALNLGPTVATIMDHPGISAPIDPWRFPPAPPDREDLLAPLDDQVASPLHAIDAATIDATEEPPPPLNFADQAEGDPILDQIPEGELFSMLVSNQDLLEALEAVTFGQQPATDAVSDQTSEGDMLPALETVASSLCQVDESTTNKEMTLTEDLGVDGSSTLTGVQVDNLSMAAYDESLANQDRLRFHSRCGILVNLTNNCKTAERSRPLDDYNNGVVMTHRPLFDGELFEIRIDRLIDKWSGSIEVGVTSHNPATMRFPNTMTNMDSGTIMMSGCKVLINGHATGSEYGYSNLDELREGDTVGMMRTASGKLHYFVNGVDQGVAYDKVEPQVWGVIDLYGMTVKVTIVDNVSDSDGTQEGVRTENSVRRSLASRLRPHIDEDSLLFHTLRDSDVVILNNGKTAHRPNAFEYFHNGIIMTNRTLKTNELFQVRLDVVISKWAGSIEIGVTQHPCNEIIFPFKMSNARSGTWAMTGEDVVRDGSVIIPQYVRDLNKLVEGDTVGVMRKEMGILHFFVNGIDQGMAAFNVPEQVYGIIDLYGRVGQATIVDNYSTLPALSPDSPISTESHGIIYPEMCFHRVHGHNVQLKRTRLTAKRHNVYSEFSDAVLFSSRPLRECEMFEIRIDQMVDCWIGSLEIGVTAILPEELEGASGAERASALAAAGDLSWNTYILSGSSVVKDGECVLSGYGLDLDKLSVGSRVGLMWHADRSLHFYQDGLDMGRAVDVPHLNIYAVVDIYGQCTQVSIIQNEERGSNYCHSDNSALTNPRNLIPPPYCFSEYCGENVWLSTNYKVAVRRNPDPSAALVFSSAYMRLDELFQIKILRCRSPYRGAVRVGLTDSNVLNAHVNRSLPASITLLPHFTAYVDGEYIRCSSSTSKEHDIVKTVRPSFEYLRPGDIVALKKVSGNRVAIYVNSEELDVAFEDVPDKVFVVAELYGNCTVIKAVSKVSNTQPVVNPDEEEADPDCSGSREYCPMMLSTSVANVASGEVAGRPATPAAPACEPPGDVIATPTGVATPAAATPTGVATPVATPAAAATPTGEGATGDGATGDSSCADDAPAFAKPRPFTFHDVCGENIELSSSDTVAIRDYGYDNALTFVSRPLERGNTVNFRVDKLDEDWSGSVMLGAVAALPADGDELPDTALQLEGECWVVDHELRNVEGTLIQSRAASALAGVDEQAVLSLHLSHEHRLEVHIDGDYICTIATIPPKFAQLYPLIDLYGPVMQVSTLLHTYKMVHSTSIAFPFETDAQDYDFFPSKRSVVRPVFSVHENDDSEDEYSRYLDDLETSDPETSDPESSIQECLGQETYDEEYVESDEADWLIEEPVPGPVGQPEEQALEQPTEQPLEPTVEQLSGQFLEPPLKQTLGQQNEPPQQLSEHPIEQLDEQTEDQPLEPSLSQPVEDSVEEQGPTGEQSEKPIADPLENPLEEKEEQSLEEPLAEHLEEPTEDFLQEELNQSMPQPGPSTSRDDEHLLQVLTQSVLGAERRRTSATPNDIYNRQLQRTKSNNSFINDLLDGETSPQGSRDSAASSGYTDEPEPDNGPGPTTPPQRRPFDFNQHPIVLRETVYGNYVDVTEEVQRDPNVRHNALFPELNVNGNDDSLDSEELMHALSESNNWPDLNEERSSSGENEATNASESLGRQEVEVHRYVNSNFGYLKNLIFYDEEPIYRVEYDVVEFDGTVATCEYLHAVLKYWRDLIPHYPENRQSIMWGNVECHCTHCSSTPEPCYSGWVRIRRDTPPPLPQSERVFWNVDGSLLRWVLLSDASTAVRASTNRPGSLQIMPSTAPYFSTLWFDEERKPLRACSAIEIEKNYEEFISPDANPTLDRMVSLLLRLEAPVPNSEEEQMPATPDDDDDFD